MPKRTRREVRKQESKFQPQIVFRIDQDLKESLEDSAKRDGRDLSSLMRKLCLDHLESEKYASAK